MNNLVYVRIFSFSNRPSVVDRPTYRRAYSLYMEVPSVLRTKEVCVCCSNAVALEPETCS